MAILTPPRKKKIVTPTNFNDPPNRGPEPFTLTGKTPFEGQTTPQATTTTGLVQEKPEFAFRRGAIDRAVDTEKQTLPVATKPDVIPIEGKTEPKATFTGGQIADPVQTAADLQRQQVQADAAAAEKVRMEAIARQLGAQGIGDAGIVGARQRGARQDIRHAAGRQLTGIDIAEQQQKTAEMEAAKERAFLGEQGEAIRALQEMLGLEGLAVTREGQAIQEMLGLGGLDVTREGQQLSHSLGLTQISSNEEINAAANELQLQLKAMGVDADADNINKILRADIARAAITDIMMDLNLADEADRQQLSNILNNIFPGMTEEPGPDIVEDILNVPDMSEIEQNKFKALDVVLKSKGDESRPYVEAVFSPESTPQSVLQWAQENNITGEIATQVNHWAKQRWGENWSTEPTFTTIFDTGEGNFEDWINWLEGL